MAQPSNNITTLFITDPNGGQPQMIKVMGGAKIPIQLATSSGTTVNSSAVKNLMKSNALQPDQQGATVMQGTKLSSRQLIALPTKQNINLQNIRGPVVLPVSNVQLKSSIQLPVRAATSAISSPMVIRTQTGSLAVASNQVTQSQNQIQLPQINVSKQATSNSSVTPLLQTQIKQNTLGTVTSAIKPANISIKHQLQQAQGDASKPDFVFIPRKNPQDQIQLPTSQSTPSQVAHFMATQQMQQQNNSLNSYPKSFMNTSILDHSSNRKRHDFDFEYNIESKRRKSEKGGKGLRHFSMKVCEKVQAKGTTSYNEVADELVNEFTESTRSQSPSDAISYDQKNIRRRVYDALNVLMAMNIISKEKKEIKWLGLPTNSLQECHKLEQERRNRIQKIKMKTQQLQDLILQQIAFKNLVERNRKVEKDSGAPPPNSAIQLPFIIVNTNKKTVIDCSISNDKTEYLFNFDDTFEIHDDIEVLKRMGMALGLDKGICTPSDVEKAKALVPKALEGYVSELSEGKSCESILSAKGIDTHDAGKVALDDIESSMSDLCGGDFIFENVSVEQSKAGAASRQSSLSLRNLGISEIKEESSSLSRHSSLLSLSQDQRTESESVSSFGEDYDPDIFEDSDVEIS